MYVQANYAALEAAVAHTKYSLKHKSRWQRSAIRAVYRSFYVLFVSVLAGLMPVRMHGAHACLKETTSSCFPPQFFGAIVGLLGAFQFWPLTIYWPIKMYVATQHPSNPWVKWGLVGLSIVTAIATAVAFVGSAYSLVKSLSSVSLGGAAT